MPDHTQPLYCVQTKENSIFTELFHEKTLYVFKVWSQSVIFKLKLTKLRQLFIGAVTHTDIQLLHSIHKNK